MRQARRGEGPGRAREAPAARRRRLARAKRKAAAPAASAASAIARLKAWLEEKGVTKAKIGGFDVDGVWRGKYVSLEKLVSAAKGGLGFCDVVFGWDIADELYDNAQGDRLAHRLPRRARRAWTSSTARVIPWEPDTAAFLLDFVNADGSPFEPSPRQLLQTIGRAGARAGLPAEVRRGVRVLHLPGDAAVAAREGLPATSRRSRRACSATRGCAVGQRRAGARHPRRVQRLRHRDRGPAHRDRARASTRRPSATTTSSRPPTRRRSSRRR